MTSEHRGISLRSFTTLRLYESSSGVFLILLILSLFYLILGLFFFIFGDFVLVFVLMVIWVCVGILSFLRFKTMIIYSDFSTSE